MSLSKAKQRAESLADAIPHRPTRGPSSCAADDCPFIGVSDRGRGFLCVCHVDAEPRLWPEITRAAQAQRWLGDLITDVQRMHLQPRKGEDWLAHVHRIIGDHDTTLLPNEWERKDADRYASRLMGELRFFVGASTHRPEPFVPLRIRKPEAWAKTRIGGGVQPAASEQSERDAEARLQEASRQAQQRIADYAKQRGISLGEEAA